MDESMGDLLSCIHRSSHLFRKMPPCQHFLLQPFLLVAQLHITSPEGKIVRFRGQFSKLACFCDPLFSIQYKPLVTHRRTQQQLALEITWQYTFHISGMAFGEPVPKPQREDCERAGSQPVYPKQRRNSICIIILLKKIEEAGAKHCLRSTSQRNG